MGETTTMLKANILSLHQQILIFMNFTFIKLNTKIKKDHVFPNKNIVAILQNKYLRVIWIVAVGMERAVNNVVKYIRARQTQIPKFNQKNYSQGFHK